jgi:hypothetical protein
MSPYLVVITHVRQQDVTEVSLAEHNNVVKAFPSDRADQPFSISILPRGARRCRSIADAYRSESADKDLTIGAVPVANEIAGSLFLVQIFAGRMTPMGARALSRSGERARLPSLSAPVSIRPSGIPLSLPSPDVCGASNIQ